jgi:hypothetical protein
MIHLVDGGCMNMFLGCYCALEGQRQQADVRKLPAAAAAAEQRLGAVAKMLQPVVAAAVFDAIQRHCGSSSSLSLWSTL